LLKILQTEAERPMTLIAAPDAIFQAGMVAQLRDIDGLLVCDVSDGTKPLGLIDSNKKRKYKQLNFDKNKLVRVWTQRAIFVTDQFVMSDKYENKNGLYVNEKGLFTSKMPYENAYPVARLITAPVEKYPFIECLWI
jgi:hypothetical protein